MSIGNLTPQAGEIVEVRQRRYLVEDTIPPVNGCDATLVALSCVDDDAQGQQLEVLWERELDAQVLSAEAWEQIASRGFDPADRFSAYLNVLRWNCVTSISSSQMMLALGRQRERGFGVNPWDTSSRFLVSHRLLVDETYAGPLRDWLGTFHPSSLLILDEAHHAAPSSGARYAIDSHITRAVRDLAPRFEHRLFLSATPHNGHSNSFSALLEIMDPQRFCRGVRVSKKMLEDVVVRRLKDDLREVVGGFPKREVVQVDIDGLPGDAPEITACSVAR